MEQTAVEIKRLKTCINDLISVLALPAIWSGNEPSQILGTLLDVLLGMLRLDFAYARLSDSIRGGAPIEMVRLAQRRNLTTPPQEIGQALNPWLAGDSGTSPLVVRNPIGEGDVSIAPLRLGLQDEVGVLVAGSKRADFPTETERLLLGVAANQAAIGLQEARLLSEQRRAAERVEQQVVERTRQLTAVNEELRKEIIERKRAEDALRRSEEQWRDVFENNPTMYFMVDATGTVLAVNPFGAEQLGYKVDELIGQPVLGVFHESDREAVQRNVATCLGQLGRAKSWDARNVRKDGNVLWVRETAKAVPRVNGPIVLIACEDITERKEAEAALREQASLLNLTHDSIFVRGMDDVITYWNRGAEELYGWTAEQAVGTVSHQLMQTGFPAPIDEIRVELLRTGRWEGELVHTKADGTQVMVASRWALQSDAEGNPLAVLETNNDITASKQAELALEDLAGRLIHTQEEERSRIGRELHDHISQTLGLLTIKIDQLRANGAITPGIGGALDELREDTSDITDDVHRLSHRLHSSTLDYLGLVPALQKLVSEFSERHDIAIAFAHASLPPSLPSEVALCLFRIAEESLTNIAKHSQARSANVHVTGTPDGIHLTVEDAGAGFDMTTLGSKGGLGFVSMQERLRVLHGTMHVDSAPSRGTRIDAWVPPMMVTSAHNEAAHRSETA